jgi:hypothetical protein
MQPELETAARTQPYDPVNLVNWDEVTVGALASQLAGLGRGCKFTETLHDEVNQGRPPRRLRP